LPFFRIGAFFNGTAFGLVVRLVSPRLRIAFLLLVAIIITPVMNVPINDPGFSPAYYWFLIAEHWYYWFCVGFGHHYIISSYFSLATGSLAADGGRARFCHV